MVAFFLVGLPLIYVADWLRFGGSGPELWVELTGLALWISLAFYARRSDLILWLGCAAHALWDAAHYARVEFVPDWYMAACIAADVGIGAFVLMSVTANPDPGSS